MAKNTAQATLTKQQIRDIIYMCQARISGCRQFDNELRQWIVAGVPREDQAFSLDEEAALRLNQQTQERAEQLETEMVELLFSMESDLSKLM